MEIKRFTKNDSGFICVHCKKEVLPMEKSSRNHCPFCLWSLHVDINPGDRANECRGELEPISATPDPKKGYVITHKCTKCGELKLPYRICGKCGCYDGKQILAVEDPKAKAKA